MIKMLQTKLWLVIIVAVVAALVLLAAYTLAPLFGHSLVPEYRPVVAHSGEKVSWQKGATPTPNGTLARTFTDGPDLFLKLGISAESATGQASDKVSSHSYYTAYGLFLLPLLERAKLTNAKIKLLEIGLGCDMSYGPGRSLSLWKTVLGAHADLWEAEYDAACVKKAQENGQLTGIHALTGDQGDKKQLYSWVEESGGGFDVIIDDGGHRNAHIKVHQQHFVHHHHWAQSTNALTHIPSRRPLMCFSTRPSSRGGYT